MGAGADRVPRGRIPLALRFDALRSRLVPMPGLCRKGFHLPEVVKYAKLRRSYPAVGSLGRRSITSTLESESDVIEVRSAVYVGL